jgi:histidyl-tRNA synthetase
LYTAPRGTVDILPEDQPYWRYIEQKIAYITQLYGYERIDVPVFEDTRLFIKGTGETTDIVQKEMYTFEDKSGNSLTLKPEGTPSACRVYLEHGYNNLPQPVKLFYISPIFRYERPQAGRYRQHHQFGMEAIGEADSLLDSEIIDTAYRFLTSLGLKDLLLFINSIGCPVCRPAYLKILRDYFAGHIDEMCTDCKGRIDRNVLRLLDCKEAKCQAIATQAPKSIDHLCADCLDHFNKLKGYLKIIGLPFEVNSNLVRGLDYYTRTVFEIQPQDQRSQSTICGGGRYDGLIETLGGKPTPGIGFAIGFERIILNLKKQGIDVPPLPSPGVYIAFLGDAAREKAVEVAAELRKNDIGVIMATSPRSLKAQLRQANNLKIPRAIIIGDDEIKSGILVLRDMATSQQKQVGVAELITELK